MDDGGESTRGPHRLGTGRGMVSERGAPPQQDSQLLTGTCVQFCFQLPFPPQKEKTRISWVPAYSVPIS